MKKKSFTLLELVTLIALIALLFSMLMPNLRKARDRSKMLACMANLSGLREKAYIVTLEGYDADKDCSFMENNCQSESAPGTYVNARWLEPIAALSAMKYSGSNWNAKIEARDDLTCAERPRLAQTTIHKSHYGINPWINRYPSSRYYQENSATSLLEKALYLGDYSRENTAGVRYWTTVKVGVVENPSLRVYFSDALSDGNWESECWNGWGSTEKHHENKQKTTFVSLDGSAHAIRDSAKSINGGAFSFSLW